MNDPAAFGTSHALLGFAAGPGGSGGGRSLGAVRALCLEPAHATEDQPFGPDVLAFRVGGRIFALLALDAAPPSLNLKGDPEANAERREAFACVAPGYHMNKVHWNTVVLTGEVPTPTLRAWIAESHALALGGLSRKARTALDQAAPVSAIPASLVPLP